MPPTISDFYRAALKDLTKEVDSTPDDRVGCHQSAERSRGLAMVEVEQPAEPHPPSHAGRWPHRRWRAAQQLVLKTLMVPLPVVVLDILVDQLSEVSLTQRHDSAETFLLDGANEPLGHRH